MQTGGGSDDRDERDERRGGGGMFRYGMGDFMFDLFYPRTFYSPYYGYYGRVDPYDRRQVLEAEQKEERSGIFEGIYSYIFGDGDPNRNVEEARLREASKVIRRNNGAVTAEQLAPFCDVDDPDEMGSKFLVEEGFVLPIVSQLGGRPEVTEDGDIIYIFDDLLVSTRGDDDDLYTNDMEYLEEKSVEFSRNPAIGNIAAAGLGVVNLGGAIYLGQVLSSPAIASAQLAGVFGLVQAGYPLLLAYAILFNAIPIARYVYTEKKNAEINARNSARRKWKTYLEVGGSKLKRKLSAARNFKQKIRKLGKGGEKTVFDTRMNVEEVTQERQKADMKKFDELLGKD